MVRKVPPSLRAIAGSVRSEPEQLRSVPDDLAAPSNATSVASFDDGAGDRAVRLEDGREESVRCGVEQLAVEVRAVRELTCHRDLTARAHGHGRGRNAAVGDEASGATRISGDIFAHHAVDVTSPLGRSRCIEL